MLTIPDTDHTGAIPLSPDALRTPDSRFENLAGYPFKPNYVRIQDPSLGGLRMHYVDEGPSNGPVVLCLHGEPSWSYLYRKMIPVFAEQGFRVIAPDLIGFGRSDKPKRKDSFTYRRMVEWMTQFLDEMELEEIHLFCQDWGGLIGLRLVANMPDRFAKVVVSNSGLPLGDPMSDQFMKWRRFSRRSPFFPISKIIQRATARDVPKAAQKGYDAPFPSRRYKAGARRLPSLVPIDRSDPGAIDNQAAWKALGDYERPFLTLFGDSDPVTTGWDKTLQNHVPGCRGQSHAIFENVGHFSQEDIGAQLADAAAKFYKKKG